MIFKIKFPLVIKWISCFTIFHDRLTHRHERNQLQDQVNALAEKLGFTANESDLLRRTVDELSERLSSSEQLLIDAGIDIENTDHLLHEETEFAKIAGHTLKAYRKLVLPIVLPKLNELMDKYGSEGIYEFLDQFDKEGWCLDRACHTLITGDIYTYFYDKDNRGQFEFMDGYQMCHWREIMKFGECNYEIQGMHEVVVGHVLDVRQTEYIEYQRELHKRAAIAIIKEHLDAIVQTHPDLLTCIEEKSKLLSVNERGESLL